MEKFTQIGMLLGIYGGLLTDRQRDVMDLYYNYDLSLSEIAEQFDISRQGVHDIVKRAEQTLAKADDSVGFLKLRDQLTTEIKCIEEDFNSLIRQINTEPKDSSDKLKEKLGHIRDRILKLGNI